ncbi:DUF4097 family beta strand repeat-containing protein [Streptomyces xiamenensis]|uniref:DUF4097 family beta strand repeat-containing protein n=1 Tax=Streptomyces xiamenensis TaxID=408015 RepID=UPI0035E12915
MTSRTLTSSAAGPMTIDATLAGVGGTITVRAAADCERATLTISTAAESGPSADAVRNATLQQEAGSLIANVQASTGAVSAGRGVYQSAVSNSGTIIQVAGNVIGGDLNIGGGGLRYPGAAVSADRIDIVATVPEGSSVDVRTQSADVRVDGAVVSVGAATVSGGIRIGLAEEIAATTVSGDIELGRTDMVEASTTSGDITIRDFGGTARLKAVSGDITVHAAAGGNVHAATVSGDIRVTATQEALDDDLDVRTNSVSGDITVPAGRPRTSQPRRRRS